MYIANRWVLTEKVKSGNLIVKARLVLRGDQDTRDRKVSSPTPGQAAIRAFLYHGLGTSDIQTADFKTAFLNTKVPEKQVQVITDARDEKGTIKKGVFWLLTSSVYGLRDAPREWWKLLTSRLKEKSFRRMVNEPCIFYKETIHVSCMWTILS